MAKFSSAGDVPDSVRTPPPSTAGTAAAASATGRNGTPVMQMSIYTAERYLRKLSELRGSAHSIQALSCWVLYHRSHDNEIVKLWLKAVKSEKRPSRLVDLFHLVNDVVQKSRYKNNNYLQLFGRVMVDAIAAANHLFKAEHLRKLDRVLEVWKTRKVYDTNFLDVLIRMVREHQDWRNGSFSGAPEDEHKFAVSDSFADIEKGSEEIDCLSNVPTPDEVIDVLSLLDDCPSADVVTRNRIVSFPSHLLEFQTLTTMSDPFELSKAIKSLEDMEKVVAEYNQRLTTEMANRVEVGERLDAFIKQLRRATCVEIQRHSQMKQNLVTMAKDREFLAEHLNSLPSASPFRDNTDSQRMPTVAELFKR